MRQHPLPMPKRSVLSDANLDILRWEHGSEAVGLLVNGFRSMLNPFNELSENKPITTPLCLNIPEFLQSPETLMFMGFNRTKSTLIFNAQRGIPARILEGKALLWFALEYLSTIGKVAQRKGMTEKRSRLALAEWKQDDLTLDYIDPSLSLVTSRVPTRPFTGSCSTWPSASLTGTIFSPISTCCCMREVWR